MLDKTLAGQAPGAPVSAGAPVVNGPEGAILGQLQDMRAASAAPPPEETSAFGQPNPFVAAPQLAIEEQKMSHAPVAGTEELPPGGSGLQSDTVNAMFGQPAQGRVGTQGYGYRMTAQDFNPAGFRPNESRSTQVGKYGGSPLFAATHAWPDSVFAGVIEANKAARDELRKAYEQFDPKTGIEDVNAPEYRDSFIRGVNADLDGYQDKVMSFWGEEDGMKRLANPQSKERRELTARSEAWNTIARTINQATKAADAVIEGDNAGTLEVPPQLRKQAEELRRKLGDRAGVDDPKKLAKSMEVFTASVSLVDQLKNDGISAMLKNAGTTAKVYEQTQPGGKLHHSRFRTLVGTKTTTRKGLVDGLVKDYARQYDGVLTEEQIRQVIAPMAEELKEEDIEQSQLALGSGGGGTRSHGTGPVEQRVLPQDVVDGSGKAVSKSVDANGQPIERPSLSLQKFTNSQGQLAGVDVYSDGSTRVDLIPVELVNVDNEAFIVGKQSGLPRAQAVRDLRQRAGAAGLTQQQQDQMLGLAGRVEAQQETEEDLQQLQKFHGLRDVMVPAKGNWDRIQNSFGITEGTANSRLGIKPGEKKQSQQATVSTLPAYLKKQGYTQKDWEGLSEEERAAMAKP